MTLLKPLFCNDFLKLAQNKTASKKKRFKVVVVVVVVLAHPTNKNLEPIFLNIFKTNYIEN
jgi:hypothetical protein